MQSLQPLKRKWKGSMHGSTFTKHKLRLPAKLGGRSQGYSGLNTDIYNM